MTRRQIVRLAPLAALPAREVRAAKPLRITKVQSVEVRNVPTGKGLVLPWDPRKIPQDTRDYIITQIFTDQGIVGTAMDGDYKLPANIAATVQQHAEAYFVGKDPFATEAHNAAFFEKVKAPVRLFYLDIALWDIIGQALGQPLWRLWGGFTPKVRPYAATVHFGKSPEERAEDALRFYELGFRAIKLRLHENTLEADLALPRKVIDAVRGKMDVMVDANQAGKRPGDPPPVWDIARAQRTAQALEDMGLYWLEEPLPRHDFDGLAQTRAVLQRMHLAGGEGNVGLGDFARYCRQRCYSYLQPDPVQSGSLTVVRKIAMLAEAFGIPFGPHHGKSGVGMLASLHMQCAAPNSGYLEYMYDPGFWNPEGFQAGFEAPYPIDRNGFIHAPEKPGLGAPWDRAFFRKHNLTWG
ncbi:MAG: mandelate racemase/muconate lactonizing enzyme family protein [Bryobacter sp.]|jgi:L-alanine-DL-glutamate epimerase-like enolase superfamily enzyme|nr:mandelate racemase/muconate lactonizing enzyme family protein [Bryobacter sp.]